jgi:hypothetical protein
VIADNHDQVLGFVCCVHWLNMHLVKRHSQISYPILICDINSSSFQMRAILVHSRKIEDSLCLEFHLTTRADSDAIAREGEKVDRYLGEH